MTSCLKGSFINFVLHTEDRFTCLTRKMKENMAGSPGLTARLFFESLSDEDLRLFIAPEVLSVLDAVFGGRVVGEDLLSVAMTLIDMGDLLKEATSRQLVVRLIPKQKRAELKERLQDGVDNIVTTTDWTETELTRLHEFFGIIDERIGPAVPQGLATVKPNYGLFDHQKTAVRGLLPLLVQDNRRAILHLPTGVGKTRTAMHVVAEFLRSNDPSVVVWLASGRELLEQAVDSFRHAWNYLGDRPVSLATMWGNQTPNLDGLTDGFFAVGLAKAWAMVSRGDPGWAARLAPRVRLVVFDEAHQSIAKTYRRIIEELTLDRRCALLGLTATPGRTWADIDKDGVLAEFYGYNKVGLDVPGENPIEYLIENGYLARPTFRTLFAEPGLHLSDREMADVAQSLDIPNEVAEALSTSEQYLTAVLGAVEQLVRKGHRRVLVFATTVRHARILAAILAARRVATAVVTSSTPERERGRAIRDFTLGDDHPMVLVNFGVLTTGFDAPKASAVVVARPTNSLVLYSQMIGRAIRGPKAGGTDTCEVLTVVDPALTGFGDVAAAFLNWEDVWQ